jgi:hypothetical protein
MAIHLGLYVEALVIVIMIFSNHIALLLLQAALMALKWKLIRVYSIARTW